MSTDTGESTASINRRMDEDVWARVATLLQSGCTLWRPPKLGRYCIQRLNGEQIGPTVSPAGVGRWERDGRIVNVGVHRYGLPGTQGGQE